MQDIINFDQLHACRVYNILLRRSIDLDLSLSIYTDRYTASPLSVFAPSFFINFIFDRSMAHVVKVNEVCRVVPNRGSLDSSTPYSIPLTLFDLRWLRFPPVQAIYFNEIPSSDQSSFHFIVEKLKASLSLTLQHFLPLAGSLTWPQDSLKPILCYAKGDAVSLTVAESDGDFGRLSSSYDLLEAQEYHPLVPHLEVSNERAAVIALQITFFPNRGFSIGISMHHAVLDGQTSISFLRSWAHICKHEGLINSALPDQLKPFYDRTTIEDLADFGSLYSNQLRDMDGPNNRSLKVWEVQAPQDSIRGTFELTRSFIQTLKDHVTSKMDSHSGTILHLSTFSLACAYTWICLVKTKETKEHESRMMFIADCRSRLDPPLPATYFGNCIKGCLAVAVTKNLVGEDGMVVALTAITEAMKSLEKNGVLYGAENSVSRLSNVRNTHGVISIAGSHRYGVYKTDFGWGTPNKVELVSIDRTGAISFSDARNGGGSLDVGLVLKKRYMDAFATQFAKGIGEN